MEANRIIVRSVPGGIEVLECLAGTRACELVASFAARRIEDAFCLALVLAARHEAALVDQARAAAR